MATISLRKTRILTSREVAAHTARAEHEGREISDDAAVTLASWYMSSGAVGSVLCAMAHGFTVSDGDLADDIYDTRHGAGITDEDEHYLDLLSTWRLDRTDAGRRDYVAS
jgi:hypothetical protein